MHARSILYGLLVVVPALAQGGILSLSPTSVNAGSGAFTLTVNGLGFAAPNVLQWDGTNLPTTFVSSTQLTASVTAAQVLLGGAHAIRNKASSISNSFSNTVTFNVFNPSPVMGSISPSSVAAGASGFLLTVTGTGFNQAAVIRWDGTPLTTTFGSSTSISATIPASFVAGGAAVAITVATPSPGGGTTAAQTLNVVNPAPTLASISPSSVSAGGAAFTLLANGTNFNPSTRIRLNGGTLATTLVSATQVSAAITAAQIATPVVYDVVVDNPVPGGGTSVIKHLSILNPSPNVTGISPAAVSGGIASQAVLLDGTGFTSGSIVIAGGLLVGVTSASPTQLGIVLPQNLLESTTVLPITVVNVAPGGGSANSALIVTGPAIDAVAPASVPVLGPTSPPVTLTVNGTGFISGDVVRMNGAPRPTTFLGTTALGFAVDGTLPITLQPGGFAVTVTRGGLVTNAVGVKVGTPAFPDNDGVVTIGPFPPTGPNQLFDIRVEVPIRTSPIPVPSVPVTLVADLAAPAPYLFTPPGSGLNLVVGPGLGSPVVLADGVGLLGPADGTLTHHEDLTTFGVSTLRGIYRSAPITVPGTLGLWISFVGVWADFTSPLGFSVTHPSGPYFF